MSDSIWNIFSDHINERGFTLSESENEEFPKASNNPHVMVEISMSLNEQFTKRKVMTFVDWLSQVGGLLNILTKLIYVAIGILQFDSLTNVLVRRLYFVQPKFPP